MRQRSLLQLLQGEHAMCRLNLACHRVPTCALAEIFCWRQLLLPHHRLICAACVHQAASIGWPLILCLSNIGTASSSNWDVENGRARGSALHRDSFPAQAVHQQCVQAVTDQVEGPCTASSALEPTMAYSLSWLSCCLQAVQGSA